MYCWGHLSHRVSTPHALSSNRFSPLCGQPITTATWNRSDILPDICSHKHDKKNLLVYFMVDYCVCYQLHQSCHALTTNEDNAWFQLFITVTAMDKNKHKVMNSQPSTHVSSNYNSDKNISYHIISYHPSIHPNDYSPQVCGGNITLLPWPAPSPPCPLCRASHPPGLPWWTAWH